MSGLVIFGSRSPLVVELEETCLRAGRPVACAVSVAGQPRLLDRRLAVALAAFVPPPGQQGFVPCAFAPARRRVLWEMACALGLDPAEALIDPAATVARSARIGAGGYVNAGAVIGALVFAGDGVLVNRAASIGHHSILGDFVSIGPGATLASNARVGDGAVIGVGAVILPNVGIGAGATVAAGAVVRKAVAAGATVAGNPARPYRVIGTRHRAEDDE